MIDSKTKQLMADFLDDLREYLHESQNNLATDERSSMEFVEIYNLSKYNEQQQSTKANKQHDNKALSIADVSHSYKYSDDYELLYDLVINKNMRIFCKLVNKIGDFNTYDYVSIYKRPDGTIYCGVKGISYFEVYDWSVEHHSDCKSMKDVLAKYSGMLSLEFVIPINKIV